MKTKFIFGIDLGTTNSALAVFANGISQIITVDGGYRTIPSVVEWESTEKVTVGRKAYKHKGQENVVFSAKCDMGTDKTYKVKTVDSKGQSTTLEVTPVDVATEVLKAIKEGNSGEYGVVEDVVITVPAYFQENQRQATMEAAKRASLNCLAILQEPVAAALAYGLYKTEENLSEQMLVVDVGGGTTDITLVQVNNLKKVHPILKDFLVTGLSFNILATGGNNHLGGDDLDKKIFELFIEKSLSTAKEPIKSIIKQNSTFQRYANTIESWKMDTEETVLNMGLRDAQGKPIKDSKGEPIKISQKSSLKTEAMLSSTGFWLRVKECIDNCLTVKVDDEYYKHNLPNKCLLVGGSTKSILLQECIRKYYNECNVPLEMISPPSDYSFQDEAVALGAAVKGAILNNTVNNISIAQTNPIPIGVEIAKEEHGQVTGGHFRAIIPRDAIIPCSYSIILTNTVDNQTEITVPLYQGNSDYVKGNLALGEVRIDEVPPKPAGTQEVILQLQVSYEGILSVFVDIDGNVTEKKIDLSLGSKRQVLSKKEQKQVEKMENAKLYYSFIEDEEKLEVLENWKVGDAIPTFLKEDRNKLKEFEDKQIAEGFTGDFS